MARDKRQYAQIDVGWYMNPKWFQVERALRLAMPDAMPDALLHALQDAKQLHLVSILYSAQARWDGRFPVEAVKSFARASYEESVTALFEVGMWINHPGGMAEVHDYLQHQPSAAELDDASSKAKKAAAARWAKTETDASSNAVSNAQRNAVSNAEKRREEKSKEVPKGTSMPRTRKAPATPIPDGWAPTEAHSIKAQELGVDLHTEKEKFIAHAQANDRRQVKWDAAFNQWLIRSAEYKQTRTPNGGGFSYARNPSHDAIDVAKELFERETRLEIES